MEMNEMKVVNLKQRVPICPNKDDEFNPNAFTEKRLKKCVEQVILYVLIVSHFLTKQLVEKYGMFIGVNGFNHKGGKTRLGLWNLFLLYQLNMTKQIIF